MVVRRRVGADPGRRCRLQRQPSLARFLRKMRVS